MASKPSLESDLEPEFDMFEELGFLYDEGELDALTKYCNWYIRSAAVSPYERHIAHSYKALAQTDRKQYRWAAWNAGKALEICPGCPWSRVVNLRSLEAYALLRNDYGVGEKAIVAGEEILTDGLHHLDEHPCSKDIPKAAKISLINDARFLLAFLYLQKGDPQRAGQALSEYLTFYNERSFFTKEEAAEELARLQMTEKTELSWNGKSNNLFQ